MISKKQARQRRAKRGRIKIRQLGVPRLSVHRTLRHIYAQIILDATSSVLVCASTVEKGLRESGADMNNKDAASTIGKLIADRAMAAGIKRIAFDRSGFKYHGRVKILAEAAREGGLEF